MKVFTAGLLAASAYAETYNVINEDTVFLDQSVTWAGEFMTLTTSIDGDEFELCINAIAPNSFDDELSSFSLMWSDNEETDICSFLGGPADGVWYWGVIDSFLPEPEDWESS